VTVEALKAAGLGSRKDVNIKVLAKGELTKKLTVHAHGFSGAAKAAIEAAGGSAVLVVTGQSASNDAVDQTRS